MNLDLQLDAQVVAGRVRQVLTDTQVAFGGLNRHMPQAQLESVPMQHVPICASLANVRRSCGANRSDPIISP